MAKAKTTIFFCSECGYESAKWTGQCPACRAWNTMVEGLAEPVSKAKAPRGGLTCAEPAGGLAGRNRAFQEVTPKSLSEIELENEDRADTGFGELNRVLGGGAVKGSLVLVGGDPGIGKSTILLQVCRNLAERGQKVLYISGEESLKQIKLRASRIGQMKESLCFLCETNLEVIQAVVKRTSPDTVVIDSIQTMFMEDVSSAPGSVSQVRECTNALLQIAKGLGITIFIVGHVTKEGNLLPKALYSDNVLDSVSCFTTTQIAKELGITAQELNRSLCALHIQYYQSGQYLLYADYAHMGLAKSRTRYSAFLDPKSDGRQEKMGRAYTHTYLVWTERGRKFIHDLAQRYLELCEVYS